jgi:hypothetical protein
LIIYLHCRAKAFRELPARRLAWGVREEGVPHKKSGRKELIPFSEEKFPQDIASLEYSSLFEKSVLNQVSVC